MNAGEDLGSGLSGIRAVWRVGLELAASESISGAAFYTKHASTDAALLAGGWESPLLWVDALLFYRSAHNEARGSYPTAGRPGCFAGKSWC